jgi:hypothetical protein
VCDACGTSYEGYDGDYGNIAHLSCSNGHNLCSDCTLEPKSVKLNPEQMRKILIADNSNNAGYTKLLKKISDNEIREIYLERYGSDETEDNEENDEGEISPNRCPICQYDQLDANDALLYLMAKSGYGTSDLLKELKSRFPNYTDFKEFLKEKK